MSDRRSRTRGTRNTVVLRSRGRRRSSCVTGASTARKMSGMRLCPAALMAGLASGLLAQQEPPRFRVAVDMVRIDAVVTDKDGHVVRDLTANEFEILQDGKKQTVTFAEFVPVSVAPSG